MSLSNEKNNVTQYLIPANVRARFEIVPGIGWIEILFTAVWTIGGILFDFLLYLVKAPIIILIILPIFSGGGYFILHLRDKNSGLSTMDSIRRMKDFTQKQKRYLYVYRSGGLK